MHVHTYVHICLHVCVYGTSLSESHTSRKNGTSIMFAKIYVEIQINGVSVKRSQKFTFKNWMMPSKWFRMCVHHVDYFKGSLLMLHIKPVYMFIAEYYQSSFLTLHVGPVCAFIA